MPIIGHSRESTPANEAIYNANKERLSLNAWVILFCLLEGQRINTIDCFSGISFYGMNMPKKFSEIRRRITEIKRCGVDLESESDSSGVKSHYINIGRLLEYRLRFNPYKKELLIKLNK